jgi:hypothetical protein
VTEEYIQGAVYWLINGDAEEGEDGFCVMEEDSELCMEIIEDLIPLALKALYAAAIADETSGPIICNEAIPNTCTADF